MYKKNVGESKTDALERYLKEASISEYLEEILETSHKNIRMVGDLSLTLFAINKKCIVLQTELEKMQEKKGILQKLKEFIYGKSKGTSEAIISNQTSTNLY